MTDGEKIRVCNLVALCVSCMSPSVKKYGLTYDDEGKQVPIMPEIERRLECLTGLKWDLSDKPKKGKGGSIK